MKNREKKTYKYYQVSNHRCRAQFKCAQTVIGQRSAGNGPNGLSYDYYYYYYYYYY